MGRIKGLVNCSVNFDVSKTAPLDARLVVDSKADLIKAETWQGTDGKGCWVYQGMIVWCSAEQKAYAFIKNPDKDGNAATLIADAANWVQVGSELSEDVDSAVAEGDDEKALSLKGGKALNTKIKTLETNIKGLGEKLSSVYTYKGSVDYKSQLPTNASNGDVYNVKYAGTSGTTPDGTNYAYVAADKSWDALGGVADLSGYVTQDEYSEYKESVGQSLETIDHNFTDLRTAIDKNASDITTLSSTHTSEIERVEGEIAKKTGIYTSTDTVVEKVNIGNTVSDGEVAITTKEVDGTTYLQGTVEGWSDLKDSIPTKYVQDINGTTGSLTLKSKNSPGVNFASSGVNLIISDQQISANSYALTKRGSTVSGGNIYPYTAMATEDAITESITPVQNGVTALNAQLTWQVIDEA